MSYQYRSSKFRRRQRNQKIAWFITDILALVLVFSCVAAAITGLVILTNY